MNKVIDMRKTVAALVKEDPQVAKIMKELGFKEITSPAALKLMGSVMTIPKGSMVKGIPMDRIIRAFEEKGYQVTGLKDAPDQKDEIPARIGEDGSEGGSPEPEKGGNGDAPSGKAGDNQNPSERTALLASLIRRVGSGEDVESVRRDFVKNFESVSVHEITDAEQSLIQGGMDVQEVQKLCDLHSALFHGKTEAEVWAEENKKAKESGLDIPEGHPVDQLRRENEALEKLIANTTTLLALKSDPLKLASNVKKLTRIRILYGKKEESIMPILYRYGITGPSDVMWGVDDEIKSEISRLSGMLQLPEGESTQDPDEAEQLETEHVKKALSDQDFCRDLSAVLTRMKEMIYKEEKILYPLAMEHLTDDEWIDVYGDLPEMGMVFIEKAPVWPHGEQVLANRRKEHAAADDGLIHFELGTLSVRQLKALLRVLPLDITFIDENEINTFFSNEGKVFSRPASAIGRKVYDCHPKKILPVVQEVISSLKSGEKDYVDIWTPNPLHPVRIRYAAVRDRDGAYIGTVELVEDFTEAKKHFGK